MISVSLPPQYVSHYRGLPVQYVQDNVILQAPWLNRIAYYQPRYSTADKRLVVSCDDQVLSIGNVDVTVCAEVLASTVTADQPNRVTARGDVALSGALSCIDFGM